MSDLGSGKSNAFDIRINVFNRPKVTGEKGVNVTLGVSVTLEVKVQLIQPLFRWRKTIFIDRVENYRRERTAGGEKKKHDNSIWPASRAAGEKSIS